MRRHLPAPCANGWRRAAPRCTRRAPASCCSWQSRAPAACCAPRGRRCSTSRSWPWTGPRKGPAANAGIFPIFFGPPVVQLVNDEKWDYKYFDVSPRSKFFINISFATEFQFNNSQNDLSKRQTWKSVKSTSVASKTVKRMQDRCCCDANGGNIPERRTSFQPCRTLQMSMQSKYFNTSANAIQKVPSFRGPFGINSERNSDVHVSESSDQFPLQT